LVAFTAFSCKNSIVILIMYPKIRSCYSEEVHTTTPISIRR
jgi:hypothetical protein